MSVPIVSEIQLRSIEQIWPHPANARSHSTKQQAAVARSMRENGFTNPLLIDVDGVVIAGHCRFLAAKKLGLTHVPVIVLEHLTPAQTRAYRIADNRLAEVGSSWSKEMLSLELTAIAAEFPKIDLTLTGFDSGEVELLQSITLGAGEPGLAEETLDVSNAPPVTHFGDMWKIGRSRLLCGDSKCPQSYEKLLGRERPHMILTDPPYNVRIKNNVSGLGKTKHREFVEATGELDEREWLEFLTSVLAQISRVSRAGSLHYIFMDWRSIQLLLDVGKSFYDELLNLVVWKKSNAGMGSFYRSQHELIAVFRYGSRSHTNNIMLGANGRHRSNVWEYAGANSFGPDRPEQLEMHPTCKPVPLLVDAIKDATHVDDLVLDVFGGSGASLIAAERVSRKARLIELDPLYCDVAIRRAEAQGLTATLCGSGQTFAEVSDERASQQA
ncbi:MAG: DNA methyltransferase [Pseudomonadota bacterium]